MELDTEIVTALGSLRQQLVHNHPEGLFLPGRRGLATDQAHQLTLAGFDGGHRRATDDLLLWQQLIVKPLLRPVEHPDLQANRGLAAVLQPQRGGRGIGLYDRVDRPNQHRTGSLGQYPAR